MTITRPIRSLLVAPLVGFAIVLALGGMGCVSYPSTPSEPAFDTDVLPIFQAHCARCHGNGPDGGALNAAGVPGMTYNAAGPNQPLGPFLTQFGDTCPPLADGGAGTCFNTPESKCKCGAFVWAQPPDFYISQYIGPNSPDPMPPPPAPPLNDWETKVVNAWVQHPICSNSANPDPTICPP
jgi:hypothetical protein